MRFFKLRTFFVLLGVLVACILVLWFLRPLQARGEIVWGITFSHTFAEHLKLDWRETYIAVLDELGVRHVRIPVYWTEVEAERDILYFDDYDWMMREAEARGARVTLVVGERVPRWPECHVPEWAVALPEEERGKMLRRVISETVARYKKSDALLRWQVENEPFLPFFGKCPPPDSAALDKEIALVRFLDPHHPIVITDSGELSVWAFAYKRGDVFGTTMYRSVWNSLVSPTFGYITYPLPPKFFWLKANIVRVLYGNKPIIVSELQGEPWGPEFFRIARMTEEERAYTMSTVKFQDNIAYARKAGFPEVYLWGVEWWYFLKTKEDNGAYWDIARDLFVENAVPQSNK